jgi:hypothetical protein
VNRNEELLTRSVIDTELALLNHGIRYKPRIIMLPFQELRWLKMIY